ncbi:hypothetical protein JXB11_02715 [Candidatus Woesearchaeota archaeon]|nr:hypothetical protein [Candidatus Woesearchaeota archaeon]
MAFSKRFPRTVKGSPYPSWEEIALTDSEEREIEEQSRQENIKLFQECIEDAKKIASSKSLKDYQTDLIHIAISLFEKRASHSVYQKERRCKDKFEEKSP